MYNASFTGLKSTECAARGGDPCPAHMRLPLMVYIGGELDAYYEVERRSSVDSA